MEEQVTAIIVHMTKSHHELAKIIEAKRQVTARVAQIIQAMPDQKLNFKDYKEVADYSLNITKNITSFLNGLADLEEALADNLSHVMEELSGQSEE